jgi:CubicO group peptidase (beta-lactamase class C family)
MPTLPNWCAGLAIALLPLITPAGAQRTTAPATASVTAPVARHSSAALARLADAVFARWDSTSAVAPGCALGVDRAGAPRFTRAWGRADLEFDAPITPATIFEAGSVSKQFTAAATVLLALDGKLNLDDDVRRYVPELPQYQRPITIRHLLNHTSGLRDWGDIVSLAGWPRGMRRYTHDDVLQVLARQSALNYPPGDRYSYTNSGYNLLAMIVARVSGMPFAEFSRTRLFEPLGLTHTQWRDDYSRIVKGRAQAYEPAGSGWRLEMPFENVHGNGGLLTTVGDLLTWTGVLEHPSPEWRALVDSMHVRGRLTSGDTISYALGLFVDQYRGVRRVQHSGSTAGYRAYLVRFPDRGLSIAVLCNAANAAPGTYVNRLTDSLLVGVLAAAQRGSSASDAADTTSLPDWSPSPRDLEAYVGEYRSEDVASTLHVRVDSGAVVVEIAPGKEFVLRPRSPDQFSGLVRGIRFVRDASGRVIELHTSSSRAYDVAWTRLRGAAH